MTFKINGKLLKSSTKCYNPVISEGLLSLLLPRPVCGRVQGDCRGLRAAWTLNHFQRVNELKCVVLPSRRRCSALLLTSASSSAATLQPQPPWLNGGRHLRLYDFLLVQKNSFALGGNCSFLRDTKVALCPTGAPPPHRAAVLQDSFTVC